MGLIKTVYLLVERFLFNSIPRKILGCMSALGMLLYFSWQAMAAARASPVGTGWHGSASETPCAFGPHRAIGLLVPLAGIGGVRRRRLSRSTCPLRFH